MSILEVLDTARAAAAAHRPAPSWQPDPTCRHQLRYWDGERWTAWVSDDGSQAEDPVELGQSVAEWSARWDNPTIRRVRDEAFAARLGVSMSEFRAVAQFVSLPELAKIADGRSEKVDDAIALLRTPREQVTGGWRRAEQAVLLDHRNEDLLARGLAVALVNCRRCGGVVSVVYDAKSHRYRCPGRHRFMLDDVTVVAPDAAAGTQAELAAGPAHKGVRL